MKKFLVLSSWRTALGNLLPSAHGHQGGSRKAIGFMLIMAFAVVGCDDSSSASAGPNDEPGVESSSSSVIASETKQSSSSITTATPCNVDGVNNCVYGSLTDSRDGQTYRTVKIGSQTWMAENLNYETGNSYCYNDADSNCTKYGRLYTWAAAMDSVGKWSTNGKGCGYDLTCSPTYPVRGVCPAGWHLPSNDEWEALIVAVDGSITEYTYSNTAGSKLKSLTGWETYIGITNEDAFGFSAFPAGYRINFGDFSLEGFSAYFWSSTEDVSNLAYLMYLDYGYGGADLGSYSKYYGFSVRCLKD